ncbi:MAG: phage antirepressor KilAC domain-containing protein [Christensenellales bacterium]
MTDIHIFKNPDFGEIRTVAREDGPWFVAADVCKVLELNHTATRRIEEDEKDTLHLTQGTPGNPNVTIVNERGLYALVLGSRKPRARAFRRWITHDVIPAIRQHGGYLTPATIEQVLADPDTIIRLATDLKAARAQNQALQVRNSEPTVQTAIVAPKADYFDELVDRHLLTGLRETAKALGVGQREFVRWLLDRKYIYRDAKGKLRPYAQRITAGLFEVKEYYNDKTQWSGTQTMVTPKGRETFRLLIGAGGVKGGNTMSKDMTLETIFSKPYIRQSELAFLFGLSRPAASALCYRLGGWKIPGCGPRLHRSKLLEYMDQYGGIPPEIAKIVDDHT